MNSVGFLVTVVSAVLLLRLPRRWAPLPFLLGALYMTPGQVVEIGPLNFTVMRLLIVTGALRIVLRGERVYGGLHLLDRLMICWAAAAVGSSLFHKEVFGALVFRLGFVLDRFGIYCLMRVFIQSPDDFRFTARTVLLLLLPLSAEMMMEKVTGRNLFASLGGIADLEVRNGRLRATGPFAHSILAGTAGAACLPLAIMFWRTDRKLAWLGFAATGGMVVASASSGPILTSAAALGALGLWMVRSHVRTVRWAVILGTIALAFVMNSPVYYLMSYIDLAGGSTGWHRCALIDAALRHLGDWWLAGTDYTRHWMPTGILANPNHTDITNVYLMMGVLGGLPLMGFFIGAIVAALQAVGWILRQEVSSADLQFPAWVLGAIVFGHAVTFMSVDYFDQSIVLYYLPLAAIGSLKAFLVVQQDFAPLPSEAEVTFPDGGAAEPTVTAPAGDLSRA